MSVSAAVLANLCVSYIMTFQNEEAEELMRKVEKAEEMKGNLASSTTTCALSIWWWAHCTAPNPTMSSAYPASPMPWRVGLGTGCMPTPGCMWSAVSWGFSPAWPSRTLSCPMPPCRRSSTFCAFASPTASLRRPTFFRPPNKCRRSHLPLAWRPGSWGSYWLSWANTITFRFGFNCLTNV